MDLRILKRIFINTFKMDVFDYPKCDVLTFASDPDRYLEIGGVMYSPLINSIEDSLAAQNISCVSITRIASKYKGRLAYGRVYGPDGSFTRAMIFKRLKSIFLKKNVYPFSNMEVKVWRKILDVTRPKLVIAILPSRELCLACKERGVWVADLQHGVISDEHYWYGALFRESDPAKWLPDCFLVWDKGSANVLKRWVDPGEVSIKVIGNPWVQRFKKIDPSDKVVAGLKEKYIAKEENKLNILVSLSWGCTDLANGYMHPELEKFIVETAGIYNWAIRLHNTQIHGFASDEGRKFPVYFKQVFGGVAVEWEQSSLMPLPLLLSQVDLHITWSSSVCMEASYFGVPSLVLCPRMQKGGDAESYFDYLVELGYVTKTTPAIGSIRSWVECNADIKSPLPFYSDSSEEYSSFIGYVKQMVGRPSPVTGRES